MTPDGAGRRAVTRITPAGAESAEDWLAQEIPIGISVDGEPFAVMMASPGDLEDFGEGFAVTEGLIGRGEALTGLALHERLEGYELHLRTRAPVARAARSLPGRSGCGLCGSRTLEDALRPPSPVAVSLALTGTAIERALDALTASQPLNARTGAMHAAGFADADGALRLVREDVGRHNALDKLVGAMRRAAVDPAQGFLVLTSRASYEMVTKAARAGIGIVVAISAPTALAVSLAREAGVTLVGFARPGRRVIYAHGERLRGA